MGNLTSKTRELFENWPELPPELKCEIVSKLTNVNDILRFLKATHEREYVYNCIRRIHFDAKKPLITIPAELVLKIKKLEYIDASILINDIDELLELAVKPNIYNYNIVLGNNFDQTDTPQAYAEMFGILYYFIRGLIESGKDLMQISLYITRKIDRQKATTLLGGISLADPKNWHLFQYYQGNFLISPFMFTKEMEVRESLYDILKLLNSMDVLKSLQIYGEYFSVHPEEPDAYMEFVRIITILNNLKSIGVRLVFGDLPYYYYIALGVHNNIVTFYLAPSIIPETFAIYQLYKEIANLSFKVIENMNQQNIIGHKIVNITLPQEIKTFDIIFTAIPNLKTIALYGQDLYDKDLIAFINKFFLNHPNVYLIIYKNNPSKDLIDLSLVYNGFLIFREIK